MAGEVAVRRVMPDDVRCAVAVNDGHLHVHQDDVGLEVFGVWCFGRNEVLEGFFAVPYSSYCEAELADRLESDLLVDGTVVVNYRSIIV